MASDERARDEAAKPQGLLRRAGATMEAVVGVKIEPGEWTLVLLMFANLFFLLLAYYVLKVIREPLILLNGGPVSRSIARGVQALVLAAAVPAYAFVANRVEPSRLVKWVLAFFTVSLTVFALLGRAGVQAGFVFFVWLGVFSSLAIAQFWSLANDVFNEADGRRLFPFVAVGGTMGSIGGAQLAARSLHRLESHQVMLMAAGVLVACIVLTHLAHEHSLRRPGAADTKEEPRDLRGGFGLILRSRYLLLIAAAVVLLNLVNTTGDFILAKLVKRQAMQLLDPAAREQFIGDFYARFHTWVTILTAGVQILLVGRLFGKLGLHRALFLLPVVALTGYCASAFLPVLALIATVKVVENGTDYSLQNTIQQALFLCTSRDSKYKAKAAIDTFFVRAGDLGSTALVAAGAALGVTIFGFALANVFAAVAWLWIVSRLARRQMAQAAEAERVPEQT
jgi:AAA family ATP:ADP antiporter